MAKIKSFESVEQPRRRRKPGPKSLNPKGHVVAFRVDDFYSGLNVREAEEKGIKPNDNARDIFLAHFNKRKG